MDEVSIHIAGSKTDWVNQGCVRSHTQAKQGAPNDDICAVRARKLLHKEFPAKFSKRGDVPFATWRNGTDIKPADVTAILRAAVTKEGNDNTGLFSLHSLRSGGATALYRATRDIDLVARFGRWRSKCISVYLWGSHKLYEGLGAAMVTGGHVLHQVKRTLPPDTGQPNKRGHGIWFTVSSL